MNHLALPLYVKKTYEWNVPTSPTSPKSMLRSVPSFPGVTFSENGETHASTEDAEQVLSPTGHFVLPLLHRGKSCLGQRFVHATSKLKLGESTRIFPPPTNAPSIQRSQTVDRRRFFNERISRDKKLAADEWMHQEWINAYSMRPKDIIFIKKWHFGTVVIY
jgi:hypothetical protein